MVVSVPRETEVLAVTPSEVSWSVSFRSLQEMMHTKAKPVTQNRDAFSNGVQDAIFFDKRS